jgi:hypothetical protein
MPPTLVVEDGTGLSTANSYATVEEADVYFDGRLHGERWVGADDDTKTAALIWATALLDQVCVWRGTPVKPCAQDGFTGTVQALRWPRVGVPARDGIVNVSWGSPVFIPPYLMTPTNIVPPWLKSVTGQFGVELIERDRPADVERLAPVQSTSSGGRSRTFTGRGVPRFPVLPPSVSMLIPAFALESSSRLVRVA